MKTKEIDYYDKRRKKMDLLNSKISLILPELMSRNIKLVDRLKNKLKVSTFFNNIEHRNKKYFNGFIISSDKRVKDLKTGLKIKKAIKQSSKDMTTLCRQMSDDLILKNADSLLKEKKLISENTEQETHIKINELIKNLQIAVKKPNGIKINQKKKIIKSLSQDEIKEAKEYIGDKIKKEEYQINDKINKYLEKLHNSFDDNNKNNNDNNIDNENQMNKIKRKKEFKNYAETIYIKEQIKFINYKKPKPFQIKDKDSTNLKRIKKCLYPSLIEELNNIKKENDNQNKTFLKDNDNENNKKMFFKKNSSMNNINRNINLNKDINKTNINKKKTIEDELFNIDVTGKDTLEVLNYLVKQGKFLSERMKKKLEKIDSLIETNLPYPTSYELVLNYYNNSQNLKDINIKNNKKYYSFYPISSNYNNYENKTLNELTPDMKKKLTSIKEDIKNIKPKKIELNPIFMTYLGYQTYFNNKKFVPYRNIEINKKLSHKTSMDDILDKKEENLFITSKKFIDDEQKNNNNKRKIKSCNVIK